MIIFGTYLASPAAHSHSAPRATGCDTISPRPRTHWSGAISSGGARCWIRTDAIEPTVHDTAHLQRPGDLRVPVMTCDFSWWQVLGSNQRRLSRRFYRPRTRRPRPARTPCHGGVCAHIWHDQGSPAPNSIRTSCAHYTLRNAAIARPEKNALLETPEWRGLSVITREASYRDLWHPLPLFSPTLRS
jgi:hypothetical protein